MNSGGALTTRSDQSRVSLPRQTSCGSRSGLRRSIAVRIEYASSFSITASNSAVGMFGRLALSCLSVSTVFEAVFLRVGLRLAMVKANGALVVSVCGLGCRGVTVDGDSRQGEDSLRRARRDAEEVTSGPHCRLR